MNIYIRIHIFPYWCNFTWHFKTCQIESRIQIYIIIPFYITYIRMIINDKAQFSSSKLTLYPIVVRQYWGVAIWSYIIIPWEIVSHATPYVYLRIVWKSDNEKFSDKIYTFQINYRAWAKCVTLTMYSSIILSKINKLRESNYF